MHEHFAAISYARHAAVFADLSGVRAAADRLYRRGSIVGIPPASRPFLFDLRQQARVVLDEPSREGAFRVLPSVVMQCGRCHEASDVDLGAESLERVPPKPSPSDLARDTALVGGELALGRSPGALPVCLGRWSGIAERGSFLRRSTRAAARRPGARRGRCSGARAARARAPSCRARSGRCGAGRGPPRPLRRLSSRDGCGRTTGRLSRRPNAHFHRPVPAGGTQLEGAIRASPASPRPYRLAGMRRPHREEGPPPPLRRSDDVTDEALRDARRGHKRPTSTTPERLCATWSRGSPGDRPIG